MSVSRNAAGRWAARRPRIAAGVAVGTVATLAGSVLAVLQPAGRPQAASPPAAPPARARVYTDYSACLLTGARGPADGSATPVWAGLQAASATTRVQVSYVPLQGPQNAANADAYVTALALRGCSVIITAGAAAGQGAEDRAAALPRVRFIVVADQVPAAPNVTALPAGDPAAVTGRIKELVTDAAQQNTATG